ncbi:hypothetical protein ACWDZ4_20080 [Streptomyces sp. NPDC003016]
MDAARSFLSAASLPVLDENSPPDASGLRVLPYNDVCVMVAPVVEGKQGAWLMTSTEGTNRWRVLNRQAIDVITAEGWEYVADTNDGGAFSPPVGPLLPEVKETIGVLERDGRPGYAVFDVSPHAGTVRIDVAGGWNCRELSISDVALPALHAAGFDVETVHEGEGSERREWHILHHLVVRPPSERREEWALAHRVRRLLQGSHRNVGWEVGMTPALPEHMPEGSAPDAHLGALLFHFSGHAVYHPGAFDYTLQDAGYVLGPSRFKWWRHMRILRPAPAGE